MKRLPPQVTTLILLALGASFVTALYVATRGAQFPVLETRGPIAEAERNLIITATLLMLTVVIPVWVLTISISWHYRSTNSHARYTPNWEHNTLDEVVWWSVPCIIVAGLAYMTIQSSIALDPFRPLASHVPPVAIQVVALDWKWLFVYPKDGIASVNELTIPVGRPIEFEITSDAPMNSFLIPQLGGQVYAMPGMRTEIVLLADAPGLYRGFSANLSGRGFADMHFIVHAVSEEEYDQWLQAAHVTPDILSTSEYEALREPSVADTPKTYGAVSENLFDMIMARSMGGDDREHANMHN